MAKPVSVNETDLQVLHDWILSLCDPDIELCLELMDQFNKIEDGVRDSEEYCAGRREVGCITFSGVQPPDLSGQIQVDDGPFRELRDDDSLLEGSYKNGKAHGFFRLMNSYGDLEFFGCLVHGVLQDVCWRSLPGGGFIISPYWDFTGENLLYLYPDCRLGFFGTFEESLLVSGHLVEVTGFRSVLQDSILVPEIVRISHQEYTNDLPTAPNLSRFPLLQDPYEDIFVKVGNSNFNNAGQGLFAKADIDPGTVICFYNGFKVPLGKETDRPTPYKINLDEKYDLDIPENLTTLSNYRATLGHKICHSFEPNCDVDTFFHPRFGTIRCIAALEDIDKGEEITINYRYNLATAPSWYKVAWARHQKMVRGLPDWKAVVQTPGLCRTSSRSSFFSDISVVFN